MNRSVFIIVPVVLVAFVVTALALVRLQDATAQQEMLQQKLLAAEAAAVAAIDDMAKVRQQLGEAQLAAADAESDANNRIVDLEAKLVRAESKLANGRPAAVDEWEDLTPGGGEAVAETKQENDPKKGFGALLESMFKDKNMKKMMRQSQTAMLDRMYGKLFSNLGLSDEKMESLKALLVERQMAGAERGMSLLTIGDDKEKMAALVEDLKMQREAADAEIAALLDPEQYAAFKKYDESLGERMQVSQFAGAAQAAGEPLSDTQTESLISLMRESNEEVFGDGFNQQDPTVGFRMMQEADGATAMVKKMEDANALLLEKSEGVLTPGQQDAFVKHQEQQAQMQKLGMEMMKGMMKPDKDGE